jgi:hypothetical protein
VSIAQQPGNGRTPHNRRRNVARGSNDNLCRSQKKDEPSFPSYTVRQGAVARKYTLTERVLTSTPNKKGERRRSSKKKTLILLRVKAQQCVMPRCPSDLPAKNSEDEAESGVRSDKKTVQAEALGL